MHAVNIAEAKARLSELVDHARSGEDVTISRRGEPMVRLVPVVVPKRKSFDIERLRRFTDSQPMQKQSAVELVRAMRDEDY